MRARPSHQGECGLVWQGRQSHAYDEPTFRHLLARERARSARLGQALLVLLIEVPPAASARAARARGGRLFSRLAACTRDTDIVGWHRRDRVAGVVVTDLAGGALAEVSGLLQARVAAALARGGPGPAAHRVHVRIHGRSRPSASIGAAVNVGAGEGECSMSA
jgi:hypothetical protein